MVVIVIVVVMVWYGTFVDQEVSQTLVKQFVLCHDIMRYLFWSTLEIAVAFHKQLSQHPTTSPSATLLLEVQLPLLGTSPKVYIG